MSLRSGERSAFRKTLYGMSSRFSECIVFLRRLPEAGRAGDDKPSAGRGKVLSTSGARRSGKLSPCFRACSKRPVGGKSLASEVKGEQQAAEHGDGKEQNGGVACKKEENGSEGEEEKNAHVDSLQMDVSER